MRFALLCAAGLPLTRSLRAGAASDLGHGAAAALPSRPRTRAPRAEEREGGFSVRSLADQAFGAFERELQLAAGQDPEELKTSAAVRSGSTTGTARPLPDSFDDAVGIAVASTLEALEDGVTRLTLEFDTAAGDETYSLLSRTLKLVQPYLPGLAAFSRQAGIYRAPVSDEADAELGPLFQVLFPDEGTSAYVKVNWVLPEGTITGSMPRAQLAAGAGALMLVAPGATEVDAVQRLIGQVAERAPGTPILVFNPKLVDMQSTGYGLVGRDLRNMVQNTFTQSFVVKTLPEGAIFRAYPDAFAVWREDAGAEGGYSLAYSGPARPSGEDVDNLLAQSDASGDEGGGGAFMGGLSNFVKGFQAL